jgi:hypothetical protein
MLTRYPLQPGVNPPRRLYVYDSLEALYLWINKQQDYGPAIHRTLEFTATALDTPFRTTPHVWRKELSVDPLLYSFRWEKRSLVAIPGLSDSIVVYAMPVGTDVVLVHWGNERGAAGMKKGLETAVQRGMACQHFIEAQLRLQAPDLHTQEKEAVL